MQDVTTTLLSETFDQMIHAFARLEDAWTDDRTRSGLCWAFRDARHHVCHALVWLGDVTDDPALLAPHAAFEVMDEAARIMAHEAYASVLSLGQLVLHAREQGSAAAGAIDGADAAVRLMLERLSPYVSRADEGMRRTMLDGEPIEEEAASSRSWA
jgi:hypothetical protein